MHQFEMVSADHHYRAFMEVVDFSQARILVERIRTR
jgi:hypothetical protein